jgi:hypothetical protein
MNFHFVIVGLLLATSAGLAEAQAVDGLDFKRDVPPDRASLRLPQETWEQVLAKVGSPGGKAGYTYEQMKNFPETPFRLRIVENLFRDVWSAPAFAGVFTDNLLANSSDPGILVQVIYSQLDAKAARAYPPPPKDAWGVPWIPARATPLEALESVLAYDFAVGRATSHPAEELTEAQQGALRAAGEPAQRLLVRLFVAAAEARPWIVAAFDKDTLRKASPIDFAPSRAELYDFLLAPFYKESNDDTGAVPNRGSYDALRRLDLNYQAFAGVIFFTHLQAALAEYRAAAKGAHAPPKFSPIELATALGTLRLAGAGDDTHPGGDFLILDLGGNDHYCGLIASPTSLTQPIGLVIDLAGDDVYDGGTTAGNVACGFMGIGALYDLAGNDRYVVHEGGLGCGLFGTGVLLDFAGDDQYEVQRGWGQGAAYAGVGLSIDLEGNDRYDCATMSEGFGGPLGIGILMDVKGNDSYHSADDGNPSKVWNGKTVSMTMGCGYGRRADSGDGQGLAGGIGVLLDAAGDDHYHTSIFSLGSGYWWGFGIFEDRAGNDTYRCTHYCLGSGAHFALGSFVDLQGDDRYNDRPDALERWGGIGRDGSIAIFIDAAGNDRYGCKITTGGHCDLNSWAVFWDRAGNDTYTLIPGAEANNPRVACFGSSVPYTTFNTFRDDMSSVGVFLDTGGEDTYPAELEARNNSEWQRQTGPRFWSLGWDLELPAGNVSSQPSTIPEGR